MSASHLRVFCLAISCFMHWMLLGYHWSPSVGPTGNVQSAQLESCGGFQAVKPSFALQRMVEQIQTDEKGATKADHRKQILALYLKNVKEEINRRKFSAPGMDKEQMQRMIGNVQYVFSIDAAGRFHAIRLERSSGSHLIDEAARAAISLTSQKVKRPAETGTATLTLKLVVKYQYGL